MAQPRKRTPAKAPAKRTDAPQANTDPKPVADTPPPDPTELLKAAYRTALDERDEATGTIPAVALDAARVAYRNVPRRQRGDLATALAAEATTKMVRPDNTVDTGLAVAMAGLTKLFADANAAGSSAERTPDDLVTDVAAVLATFDAAEVLLTANLTEEQRKRVQDLRKADPADANGGTLVMRQKTAAKLVPLVALALDGPARRPARNGQRTRSSGGPARDIGALVAQAVTGSEKPVYLATIAREKEISTGALGNRWAKDNIPGVTAIEVEGRKAFAAAA